MSGELKEYWVTVPEVWQQQYTVIAGSPKEALAAVLDGDGSPHMEAEYSRAIDLNADFKGVDTWSLNDVSVSDEENVDYIWGGEWKEGHA